MIFDHKKVSTTSFYVVWYRSADVLKFPQKHPQNVKKTSNKFDFDNHDKEMSTTGSDSMVRDTKLFKKHAT
jgi:hypothetical protein